MAITFGFYLDSGLTQPASSLAPYRRWGSLDGSIDFADGVIYLGSTDDTKQVQVSPAVGTPGTTHISVSIADSAPSTAPAASVVKLALSSGGLASATGGAALDLGIHTLAGGVAEAIPIHIRVADIASEGTHTDLSFNCIELLETEI